MTTGIFIDDTGNSGIVSKSDYDSKDRKTWLAVILNPEHRKSAGEHMQHLISELKVKYGVEEYHFKDIYGGTGKFKGVHLLKRIELFETFAELFRYYKYPMLISTIGSEDLKRNKLFISNLKIKFSDFKLAKNEDLAMFLLLHRIRKHLRNAPGLQLPVEIFVDSGRQEANTVKKVDMLDGLVKSNQLVYKSSHNEPLIQLADFAAFCLNRHRWIATNNMNSPLDIQMNQIFAYADFNVLNMVKKLVPINSDTTAGYDKVLKEAFDRNESLDEEDLHDLILNFYR